jgi:hypothetical protein
MTAHREGAHDVLKLMEHYVDVGAIMTGGLGQNT